MEDVSEVVTSLASRWLFTVGKVGELQGKRLYTFHSFFYKLICIFQIGRPYCAKSISFLYTRMKYPVV